MRSAGLVSAISLPRPDHDQMIGLWSAISLMLTEASPAVGPVPRRPAAFLNGT